MRRWRVLLTNILFLVTSCGAPNPSANPEPPELHVPATGGELPVEPPHWMKNIAVSALPSTNAPLARREFSYSGGGMFLTFAGHNEARAVGEARAYIPDEDRWRDFSFPSSFDRAFGTSIASSPDGNLFYGFGGAAFLSLKAKGRRVGAGFTATRNGLVGFSATQDAPSPRDGHCVVGLGGNRFLILFGDNDGKLLRGGGLFNASDYRYASVEWDEGWPPLRREAWCFLDPNDDQSFFVYGGMGEVGPLGDLWRGSLVETKIVFRRVGADLALSVGRHKQIAVGGGDFFVIEDSEHGGDFGGVKVTAVNLFNHEPRERLYPKESSYSVSGGEVINALLVGNVLLFSAGSGAGAALYAAHSSLSDEILYELPQTSGVYEAAASVSSGAGIFWSTLRARGVVVRDARKKTDEMSRDK